MYIDIRGVCYLGCENQIKCLRVKIELKGSDPSKKSREQDGLIKMQFEWRGVWCGSATARPGRGAADARTNAGRRWRRYRPPNK
jgi:hypothetical protein